MAGIFKKAIGLFVEFEEDKATYAVSAPKPSDPVPENKVSLTQTLKPDDLDKFEKHFEQLFDQANLPGPDYYEFWKMMETLEAHIKDERARISATYASLAIQGLTKERLVTTATRYKEIIQEDKNNFEKAAQEKSEAGVGHKRKQLKQLETTMAQHAEMIRKLTQEITDSQGAIKALQESIAEEEQKLEQNKHGYTLACDAMLQKITEDINKIQTTL